MLPGILERITANYKSREKGDGFMPKPYRDFEYEIKQEDHRSLLEFADMLEKMASRIKKENKIIFSKGNKKIVIQPSQWIKVEMEYEVKGDRYSFEIELEWENDEIAFL